MWNTHVCSSNGNLKTHFRQCPARHATGWKRQEQLLPHVCPVQDYFVISRFLSLSLIKGVLVFNPSPSCLLMGHSQLSRKRREAGILHSCSSVSTPLLPWRLVLCDLTDLSSVVSSQDAHCNLRASSKQWPVLAHRHRAGISENRVGSVNGFEQTWVHSSVTLNKLICLSEPSFLIYLKKKEGGVDNGQYFPCRIAVKTKWNVCVNSLYQRCVGLKPWTRVSGEMSEFKTLVKDVPYHIDDISMRNSSKEPKLKKTICFLK